jgi:hypothetical protein
LWQVLYRLLPLSIQVKAPLKGRRMMMIASDLKTKVEVDFDSDNIGVVEAPARKAAACLRGKAKHSTARFGTKFQVDSAIIDM